MAIERVPRRCSPRKPLSKITVSDGIAYVELANMPGLFAMVDEADIPLVAGYRWLGQNPRRSTPYALRYEAVTRRMILMHRVIMRAGKGGYVDHKDRNGLNNRSENLRFCSASENGANRGHDKDKRLPIKGVMEDKRGKFLAHISHFKKKTYLGTYDTIAEASAAYRGAAKLLWGEFAYDGIREDIS